MLKLICALATVGTIAGFSAPAAAQVQSSTPAAQPQPAGPNPNEVICQKQEVIGSRLSTKRVCKTRAEWADAKLEDRHAIEKIQTERSMPGN